MNCQQFDSKLNELLDRRLQPDQDEALGQHADRCPRCARLLSDYQSLVEAINGTQLPDAGNLAARILAEVTTPDVVANAKLADRESQRNLAPRPAWIAAGLAAALLIAVGTAYWNNVTTPTGSHPQTVVTKNAEPRHSPNDGLMMISMEEFHTVADLIDAQHRNLEQVSDRLRPVTRSMSAAFQALRHSQPRGDSPARSS
jgi:hypothetical protein